MDKLVTCWCGNNDLLPFSSDYFYCGRCKTLVLREWADENFFSVKTDEQDFYGKSYWFDHQQKDLGFDNILTRARADIPGRVLHWLRTLLKYKLPPGSTLELGCSHGGFVSVLHWAGFQASGLELSPWVVDFARETFQIPMYLGGVEDQKITPGSLDAILLMDVLEHLPDPVSTICAAAALLKKDGVMIIQTPCYSEERSFEDMQAQNDPFLMQFKTPEHVYLFSQSSVQEFLARCHLPYIQFEPAFFSQYDMFLVASQSPLQMYTQEDGEQALTSTPGGRLILALLDCNTLLQKSDIDRAARLEQIDQYDTWLKEAHSDQVTAVDQLNQYDIWLKEAQNELKKIRSSLVYKVGRRLGMFK